MRTKNTLLKVVILACTTVLSAEFALAATPKRNPTPRTNLATRHRNPGSSRLGKRIIPTESERAKEWLSRQFKNPLRRFQEKDSIHPRLEPRILNRPGSRAFRRSTSPRRSGHRRTYQNSRHARYPYYRRSYYTSPYYYPYYSYRPYGGYYDSSYYYDYDREYKDRRVGRKYDDKANQLPPKRPLQLPETASAIEWHLRNIAHAFAAADYSKAAFRARQAVKTAPENIDLRLAYSQSLFADGQYQRAQRVLQTALNKAAQTNQKFLYPIDLYQSPDLLNKQTERLRQTIEDSRSGTKLQFLLAYHLFGLGNYDQAFDALTIARIDYTNKEAVEVLLTALDQAKKGEKTEPTIEKETPPKTDNY